MKIHIHTEGRKHLSDGGVEDLEVGRLWVRRQDQGPYYNAWGAAGKLCVGDLGGGGGGV